MIWLLVGCAMKRTWDFTAGPTTVTPITVEVVEADVAQKDVRLELALKNESSTTKTVDLDSGSLSIPDGSSWVAVVADGEGLDHPFLVLGKQRSAERVVIEPGERAFIEVRSHQYGRDLRRHEHLNVALDVRVDGLPVHLPLRLVPPPNAPRGEHI